MSRQEAEMLLEGLRQEENAFGKLDDQKNGACRMCLRIGDVE